MLSGREEGGNDMAGVSQGAAGEVLAARFLRSKGYEILAANFRTRFGEIDIIAADGQYIAFVEVKARQEGTPYAPREAVGPAKQRRLRGAAGTYLARYPNALQPRFDVIEVITARDNPMRAVELNHILHAFEAGDLGAAF